MNDIRPPVLVHVLVHANLPSPYKQSKANQPYLHVAAKDTG